VAKNCLLDSKLFQTKKSGRINLRTTVNLQKELGLSRKELIRNYGRYAGCIGLQMLKQEQNRGAMLEPVLLIDGRPSNNPYGAKPIKGTRIRYIDKNIAEIGNVGMMVLQRLIEKSPIGPAKKGTHYWECHILLVNGREWKPADGQMKVTDTMQIVNTKVYARRLEQGWSMEAPSGIYKPTYSWAKQRFGDSFTIRYGFRPLGGVKQNQVRRYNFPKVKPGSITNATNFGTTGFGKTPKKGIATTMVTHHAAAAAKFGFKNVAQVFPFIELKPKELAAAVGATAGSKLKMRSFKI
jgi:hypothetical protein